ncbi:MAG: ribosome assembly RNA-binding protein YhbY [Steroidobacteraceae bacterium]
MKLSDKQRRYLAGRAHPLRPVVQIGAAGLTESVTRETERALADHELIKVRMRAADRQARDAALAELARRTASALVHRIGHVAVLYRPRAGLPGIVIPDD